jgi:outer membrane immunogenic protein
LSSFFFANDFRANDTRWGGMVGAGLEYAFNAKWSAKIEYDFIPLGDRTITLTDALTGFQPQVDVRQHVHLFKLGVNYRLDSLFDLVPVVGR